MNLTALLIAAIVVSPAAAVVAWAWFSMARVEVDLCSLAGLEGMRFDA